MKFVYEKAGQKCRISYGKSDDHDLVRAHMYNSCQANSIQHAGIKIVCTI